MTSRAHARGLFAAAAALVLAGVTGWTVAPTASADTTPAPAAAPATVETFSYPDAQRILAERGITLTRGDGGITLTDCADGNYQIKLGAITPDKTDGDVVCFKAPGASGYLALSIPDAYRIHTYDRSIRASLSTNQQPVETVDVAANTSKGIGQSIDPNAPAVVLELRVTGSSTALPTPQPTDPKLAFAAKLNIGNGKRACTATLVDRSWLLTAASCFTDTPDNLSTVTAGAPKDKTTATIGRTDLTNTTAGAVIDVVELVPHQDRDLVMARLATPVDGINPAVLSTAAPTAGESLRALGFGRTVTDWVPTKLHTNTHIAGVITTTGVDTTPAAGQAPICQGDAGAPVIREVNGKSELVAVSSRSWQGGCLGAPVAETRTDAFNSRVDNIASWVQQTRAKSLGWKTQALVRSDDNLYFATRLYDGSWTPYEDVQAAAGNIGGVRAVATAGINTSTHIIALGGDGHLHYAIRNLDGIWAQRFVDLNIALNDLGNITQVSISPIGDNLHVVVVADDFLFHTVRNGAGQWSGFGVVTDAAGPLKGITSISAAGAAGGDLHIAAVSGGKIYHTLRNAAGSWGAWGSVADAAGATAPVTAVAISRQSLDLNLAFIASDGQYHTLRWANGSWQPVASLGGVIGNVIGTSISAAPFDTDAQFAIATTDNKVLLTARHADGTWAAPETLNLTSIPGNHTGTMITSSL
ncbi:trypsin-like serine protease [Kitasatospora sp. NPDC001547]|uniref:trypsin-like serine protease n=1 Tax=Kitasatospora sp. NPDC001547 TaxID=3364015 RepID=UPI003691437F